VYESLSENAFPSTASRSQRRRTALVAVLGTRAESILDRVVSETLRATDFVGLGRNVAARYTTVVRACLPFCLAALGATDPERARLFDENAHIVKDLAEVGVPKFVQRGLVSFGFRLAAGIVRQNARPTGFEPDELEDELRVFQRAFEARLYFGV